MPRFLEGPRRRLAALVVFVAAALPWAAPAGAIDTRAREAILIDATTGSVLFEHNADQRMPTASMSKIMTMFLVFEALEEGRLSLEDTLPVSEHAWQMGGSRMFVEVDTRVAVEDLIRGVIVQSGNDASVVLAEGLAGSEEEFARRMTERAHEIGLSDSNFTNATGWPDPNHYSTARDLATLAEALIRNFPEYYSYYSETEFQYGVGLDGEPMDPQHNRNPLLYRDIGADGLKTGHTQEAGYGLTASAVQSGRRLILVINGLPSASARAEEAVRLMSWGFREFDAVELFDAGETVETAAVWMGEASTVPMVVGEDLAVTLRQGQRNDLRVVARLDEPVPAPIRQGERIGTLVISAPEMPVREEPLLAGETVERRGFLGRVAGAIGHYALSLL
jgi:D-alanyl-D-alanine carboxypeptidase (penicillin-binding protein 5/6)